MPLSPRPASPRSGSSVTSLVSSPRPTTTPLDPTSSRPTHRHCRSPPASTQLQPLAQLRLKFPSVAADSQALRRRSTGLDLQLTCRPAPPTHWPASAQATLHRRPTGSAVISTPAADSLPSCSADSLARNGSSNSLLPTHWISRHLPTCTSRLTGLRSGILDRLKQSSAADSLAQRTSAGLHRHCRLLFTDRQLARQPASLDRPHVT